MSGRESKSDRARKIGGGDREGGNDDHGERENE